MSNRDFEFIASEVTNNAHGHYTDLDSARYDAAIEALETYENVSSLRFFEAPTTINAALDQYHTYRRAHATALSEAEHFSGLIAEAAGHIVRMGGEI